MTKKAAVKILLIIAILCLAFGLVACQDLYGAPEDYVEVESLRVESANIALSPSGETSQYQLKVEVLPAGANRALEYYIPSQYQTYVQVSDTGLITARGETPEGVTVPLRVTSTTNRKATLTINIIVENVEVRYIDFDPDVVTLSLDSKGLQMKPIFTPWHGQDGRTLSYSSLNENVATVDSTGYVRPVGAGSVRIVATGRTSSGKSIQGYLTVYVVYNPSQYMLVCSDNNPHYNQVLGNTRPINFTLLRMDDKSDPNPSIYWYVGAERDASANGKYNYEHTPSVNTTTSYTIKVRIEPMNESPITLESELINIYNPFRGFDIEYGNLTTTRSAYQFGDYATFELPESLNTVVRYDWYLKKLGGTGYEVKVAETAADNRNLTRRLNIEGDFVLTARGKDGMGTTVIDREFAFGVTKYTVGDTLLMKPTLLSEGMPPESYDFDIYVCNSSGERLTTKSYVGSALHNQVFQYYLRTAGFYDFGVYAVSDGTVAKVDGQEYFHNTTLIRVYEPGDNGETYSDNILGEGVEFDGFRPNDQVNIEDVTISGIADRGAYKPLVKWRNVTGLSAYVVELTTSDGRKFILDSDGADASYFGENYLIIPEIYVGLDESFSVRIKQKGGLFGDPVYYGVGEFGYDYFPMIDSAHYSYLVRVDGNAQTLYMSDMESLGELLRYVALVAPTRNEYIGYSVVSIEWYVYAKFTFNVYLTFGLSEIETDYPTDTDLSGLHRDLQTIYAALLGAQVAYLPTGAYEFSAQVREDGGYAVTMLVLRDSERRDTSSKTFATGNSANYSSTPYGNSYTNFAINLRETRSVSNTDRLYSIVERGYRPTFTNDPSGITYGVYQRAQNVIRQIIGPEMTDKEKLLAIFDWLALNVLYDTELAAREVDLTTGSFEGYKLEGVFKNGKAVCDGIAKALVLLCGIEGISAIRVVGNVNGSYHAWNKVRIDGEWYVVDATNGSLREQVQIGDVTVTKLHANHAYFMISDAQYRALFSGMSEYGNNPSATEDTDYFADFRANGVTLNISSAADLEAILTSFTELLSVPVEVELKFNVTFANGAREIAEAVSAVSVVAQNRFAEVVYVRDNRAIVTIAPRN